jgi:hypothetical protein
MEVTFNFKYKDSSIFSNGQSAGFIANCINPPAQEKGDKGKNGSMLYITDYYLDSTYNKNLCLENIENNILPTTNGKKLEGRTYVIGDLFVTPTREIYKLINAPEGSKYTYDFKYLGMIKKQRKFNIIDYIEEISINCSTSLERCMVPVNRGMDSSINDCTFVTLLEFPHDAFPHDVSVGEIITKSSDDITFNGITDTSLYYDQWDIDRHFKIIAKIEDSTKSYMVLSSPTQLGGVGKGETPVFDGHESWNCVYRECYPALTNRKNWYEINVAFPAETGTHDPLRYYPNVPVNTIFTKQGSDALIFVTKQYTIDSSTYITFQTDSSTILPGTGSETRFYSYSNQNMYIVTSSSGEVKQISNGIGLSYISPLYRSGEKWDSSMNLSTAVRYKDAYRGMYGIKFKPVLRFKDNLPDGFDISNYEFYLRAYIYNTKRFNNSNFSLRKEWSDEFNPQKLRYTEGIKKRKEPVTKPNNSDLNFYKCMEFPLIVGDDSSYYPTYVSDYVADKIHPSGNNISVNYDFYNREQTYTFNNETYQWTRFVYDTAFTIPYDDECDNYRIDAVLPNKIYFFQVIYFYNLFYDTYRSNHALIQYYKFPENDYTIVDNRRRGLPYVDYQGLDSNHLILTTNYRGGESAFFSGMVLPRVDSSIFTNEYVNGNNIDADYNKYISYLKLLNINENDIIPRQVTVDGQTKTRQEISTSLEYVTKEHVARTIRNILFSPNVYYSSNTDKTINDFEILCIDKRTRESIVLNINNLIKVYHD